MTASETEKIKDLHTEMCRTIIKLRELEKLAASLRYEVEGLAFRLFELHDAK